MVMTTDSYAVTLAEFAGVVLERLDRPVIDKTGLAGRFDIHLESALDNAAPESIRLNGADSPGSPGSSADTSAGPSMFTAMQPQLGLKLSPETGPVDVLVIDRVEKPSAN